MFSNLVAKIPYDDIQNADRLIALVEAIYIARWKRELRMEEILYRRLIKIMRTPDLLIELTKRQPDRPQDLDDKRRDRQQEIETRRKEAKQDAHAECIDIEMDESEVSEDCEVERFDDMADVEHEQRNLLRQRRVTSPDNQQNRGT